jgi:phospholipid/cholesterol/gamma-HCH transport system substrate-binding protein
MVLATLLFLGSVATLAGLKLWNPKDRYYVRFVESISGLELGSPVKMKGVRVGQVEKIRIGDNVESVVVTLALVTGTPIPEDIRAVMTSIGITGLQFIELTGGSGRAKRVAPNTPQSFIGAGTSTLSSLTGKAEHIAKKVELVLNNLMPLTDADNRALVKSILQHVDELAAAWTEVAQGNTARIKHILANVDRTTQLLEKAGTSVARLAEESSGNVRETLAATASAARSVQRAVQNLNPQGTLAAITGAAQAVRKRVEDPAITQAVVSLNVAANRVSTITTELSKVVRQRDRQLGYIMENLDRASSNMKEFTRIIKERPSLLLRGETVKERRVP